MQMVPTDDVSGRRVPPIFADLAQTEALRVLVVDDVLADALLTAEMLELSGHGSFRVEMVGCIGAARQALARGDFSVALLDLGLPDADGVEGVRELALLAPKMPIVVVSGNEDESVALLAIEHGAQDYLVKGKFDPSQLVHALRYAIERGKLMCRLEASQGRLQTVIEHTADGIVVVDRHRVVQFANARASHLLIGDSVGLVGRPLGFDITPGQQLEIQLPASDTAAGGGGFAELDVGAIEWEGEPALLVSIHDSTRTKCLTEALATSNRQLQQLALLDPLTELYNRRGFRRAMESKLANARRGKYGVAALIVDCDDFKRVNDAHGHAVGDTVLRHVAQRLLAACRCHDVVARIGGDEFLVLLPNADLATAVAVAERIRLAICSQPLPGIAGGLPTTVSVGATMLSEFTASVGEVLALSHPSLKRSKTEGKNRVSCSEPTSTRKLDRFEQWLTRIDIVRKLSVVWQPIIRVADETVVGHELLIRGPQGIAERPSELLKVARERGFLLHVDADCLVACLHAATQLGARGRLHVKIEPSVLLEIPDAKWVELFARLDLDSDTSLCLEINGREYAEDLGRLCDRVRILRSNGVRIALDDVGMDSGTLDPMVALGLDQVKLSRCLVAGAFRNQRRAARLEKTIRSIKALGNEVIAEGVEERGDFTLLQELGVDFAQGFLWSKPVAAPITCPELLALDTSRATAFHASA